MTVTAQDSYSTTLYVTYSPAVSPVRNIFTIYTRQKPQKHMYTYYGQLTTTTLFVQSKIIL